MLTDLCGLLLCTRCSANYYKVCVVHLHLVSILFVVLSVVVLC